MPAKSKSHHQLWGIRLLSLKIAYKKMRRRPSSSIQALEHLASSEAIDALALLPLLPAFLVFLLFLTTVLIAIVTVIFFTVTSSRALGYSSWHSILLRHLFPPYFEYRSATSDRTTIIDEANSCHALHFVMFQHLDDFVNSQLDEGKRSTPHPCHNGLASHTQAFRYPYDSINAVLTIAVKHYALILIVPDSLLP